jgi:hypothetical protein
MASKIIFMPRNALALEMYYASSNNGIIIVPCPNTHGFASADGLV